ncbi:hypothetical protein [Streptomyces kronopolitis]
MTTADRYTTHLAQGFSHVQRQEPDFVRLGLSVAKHFERVLQELA